MKFMRSLPPLAAVLILALAANSEASFHLWDINEVYTNHDGTVQFIELQAPLTAPGENLLAGHTLRATSTVAGTPTDVTFNFTGANPSGSTADKHILIATATFAALAGSVTPDYATLPANFFNPNADSILFDFAESADTVTIPGSSIPKDGLMSLTDSNLFGIANFVSGTNSPTNFAGQSGSINVPPPSPTGDYNGDHVVDAADYTVWRDTLGQTVDNQGDGADGNSSGVIDPGDYQHWKDRFGNVVPMDAAAASLAVPEPSILPLIVATMIALPRSWRRP